MKSRVLFPVVMGLTALAPIDDTAYLPFGNQLSTEFAVGEREVQLTLSIYLIGCGAGQLISGLLVDSFGRRYTLLWAIVLYRGATLTCAFSPDVSSLTMARFFMEHARARAWSVLELSFVTCSTAMNALQ